MKIFDISWPISTATTGYKDRFVVQINEVRSFDADNVRESTILLSAHTGTHVDAPSHFLRDGKTIDQITLDRTLGAALVLDCTNAVDAVTADHLAQFDAQIEPGSIVLLKTANSLKSPTEKFNPHFIYLDITGAQYLARKKVHAVGIDYLGIERAQEGHLTHKHLMHADVVIIEGLRLAHVPAGSYFLICLPLAVIGAEAAPARAILIQEY